MITKREFPCQKANSLIVLSLLKPIHSLEGGTFLPILSGVVVLKEPLPWSGVKQSLSVFPKCCGTKAFSLVRRRMVLSVSPKCCGTKASSLIRRRMVLSVSPNCHGTKASSLAGRRTVLSVSPKCRSSKASSLVRRTVLSISPQVSRH